MSIPASNENKNTIYLITGANRGIGRCLTDLILSRPNTTVVALVRDLEHETTKSLVDTHAHAHESLNKLIVIPYDASVPGSADEAISTLQSPSHKITHVDVVIANAGMLTKRGPAIDTPAEDILSSVRVNAIAPLDLFRALFSSSSLMSPKPTKFIAISSAIGSTQLIPQHAHSSTLAYGLSKAALNHAMRKLSVEYPETIVEVLTPGPVMTDLMRENKDQLEAMLKVNPKLMERFTPIEQACKGLLGLIDSASKETSGGFRDWSGEVIPF
ncbi:hypothetical protein H2204_003127 [Knufia peltigerae]|uniref:Uncharacterized protein n=1 Tax=Knufia peltigerae TaxID=1002370 RepID=A0AA38YA03_9EURO|nr:hypothetical protein H2204_003127 [Knufia peltigerae]